MEKLRQMQKKLKDYRMVRKWQRELKLSGMELVSLFLLFFFICCSLEGVGSERLPANLGTFDIRDYGARGDGRTDDSKAFMAAWKVACRSSGVVKLVIPYGIYFTGPLKFQGPCHSVSSLTVQMQGTLKASTNLNEYTDSDWVEFGSVDGLTLTGGTFDGQGAASWPFNTCSKQKNCQVLPTNIMFVNTKNTVVTGITSINSKFFHIGILGCTNFKGSNIKIRAPDDSPNTDGIHLERSSGVTLSHLNIGTGDDCVSVGPGNFDVTLTGIECGPGHGISVGSLGRYSDEGDVVGLLVKDSTVTGTTNGVRIKTWQNSPSPSIATNITFDNIIMNNVDRPIIIDQEYCPYSKCDSSAPSRVKLSDITFKNIRGTSKSADAVTLNCSQEMPCKNVRLEDVRLQYVGEEREAPIVLTSTCHNVKPTFSGTQNPPPCQ